MDPTTKSLSDYVRSGEYFTDAKNWYYKKHLFPAFERSTILIFVIFSLTLNIGLFYNIYYLLPITSKKEYITPVNDGFKRFSVNRATEIKNNNFRSIALILLKNYINNYEKYKYEDIKKQLIFLKNNSDEKLFNKFYNDISLKNPNSLILTLRKDLERAVVINSYNFLGEDKIIFTFSTKIVNYSKGQSTNEADWGGEIDFYMDKPENALKKGKLDFKVNTYKITKIRDRNNAEVNK